MVSLTSSNPNAAPAQPVNPPPPGTVDITNLVEQLRTSFVSWGTKFIITTAGVVPWLSWLNLPVIKEMFEFLLTKILDALSKGLEMQGFFLNTAIRKAGQAKDFVDAVNAKTALPTSATKEEYENAEKLQMAAFGNLVRITN